jgi:hypothetical protein
MDFADDSYYQPGMHLGLPSFAPLNATNLWSRDSHIKKQFSDVASTHQPDVYTLPRDHTVMQQPMLTPCEDMGFLLGKFQRDICAVMGVPEDMVRSKVAGGGSQENTRKTMATGRVFSSNMAEVCRQLQELLRRVSVFSFFYMLHGFHVQKLRVNGVESAHTGCHNSKHTSKHISCDNCDFVVYA